MNAKAVALRSVWVLLFTVLGIAVTASLGMWQLRRAETKQQLHDMRMARQQLPALSNGALSCQAAGWQQQEQMRATLTGHWLHEFTVVLDNRTMAGRAGFVVLTPLKLAPAPSAPGCAASAGLAVLVQRGWLPRHALDRTQVPQIARPQGLVTVPVRLTFAPSKMLSLQTNESRERGVLRQNVDLSALAQEWRAPLLPGSAQQMDDETLVGSALPAAPKLLRQWWQPEADVGKHHAYAAQWFLMALTMLGLYGWFQWWRPHQAIDQ